MARIDQRCRSALQLACSPRLTGQELLQWEAQAPFALHGSQAGHHQTGKKKEHHHRNTHPDKTHLLKRERGSCGFLVTASPGLLCTMLPQNKYTVLFPRYMLNSLFLPTFLQVLSRPSTPSSSSLDWTTPIPSFSPHRSRLLNHPFTLFSSRLTHTHTFGLFCCFWRLWVENWFKTPAETLPHQGEWKDRCTLLLLACLFHDMSLMTHGQPGIYHQLQSLSAELLLSQTSPILYLASPLFSLKVYNFVLTLCWIASFFPGDFSILSPNSVLQKAQSSSHVSIVRKHH